MKYYIFRKTEFFVKHLSRWLRENTIKEWIYYLLALWNAFQLLITTVSFIIVWNVLRNDLETELLIFIFLLYILISGIFDSFFLTVRVLSPFDEEILAASPLNNRGIFLFTFISEFLIKKFWYYSSLFIATFILTIIMPDLSWSFLFAVCATMFLSVLITFILTVLKCFIQVRRVKKGYKLEPFFYIFGFGILIFSITTIIFQGIFQWIQDVKGFWIVNNWGALWVSILERVEHYLTLKMEVPSFDLYLFKWATASFTSKDVLPALIWLMIFALLALYSYRCAGIWYRQSWKANAYSLQKDWFYWLERFFLALTSKHDLITRTQIKNLFRDRKQLSHDFSEFYGHYFHYFYMGIAYAAAAIPVEDSSYLRFFVVFFLFYRIAVDTLESVNAYPDILRFDGEGAKLILYRISNQNLIKVYRAKILVQRLLGLMEASIFSIIIGCILALSWVEIVFVSTILFVHCVCLPHLSTLHSYISPHIYRQHYGEADEHVESEWLQNILSSNVLQLVFFFIIVPILLMILAEVDSKWLYIVTSVWMLVLYGVVFSFIYMILYKFTPIINKKDLK